jgi:hypothetical protein
MAQLSIVAQNIMDLYYQQYKADEDFFELSHFEYLAGVAYGKILQDEYEKNYKMNLQIEGYGFVDLSQDWLKIEELKLEKDAYGYFIKLSKKPLSFLYDKQSSAIQNIVPLGGTKCAEFIRMNAEENWKICALPNVRQIFWFLEGDKIRFENLQCKPEKLKVLYVPELNDSNDGDFNIPKSKEADIVDWVLNRMFVARQGNVVDMTNDSNPNKTMGTEINNIFSQIKTKA